ncbi:phosphate ABC transporter substrate-binding protein [Massilia aurea]|uniref:phosphate ABC transporter substrate-binding protein n=1 Tax=Massilia aurea TaxID=373040 RepID=UPI0034620EEA
MMNRLLRPIFTCLCLCPALALSPHAARAADLAVIVSARSPVMTLRADQVAEIFLSQTNRFPNGSEVVPIDQDLGSPLRNEFYSKVTHRTPALVKAHWARLIFTGRGQPPAEVAGNDAMRKMIAENPGMIGYVERSALDASVRAVLIVR